MAIDADQGAEGAVEFDCGEGGMRLGVEGVDILRNYAADEPQCSDLPDGLVGGVRAGSVQIRPAEEASRPVSFAGFVVADEFVIVDWSVGLVQGVGAIRTTVVGEA